MTFVCSWCLLAGFTKRVATKQGEPAAYDEITGKPICPDCVDEIECASDVLREARP